MLIDQRLIIMQTKSFRELDKLVAEKIFGWYDFTDRDCLMGYLPQEEELEINAEPERQEVLYYSSDMESAWTITEKFYSVNLSKLTNDAEFEAYLVTTDGKKNIYGYAKAKTPEIALCLAALRSKAVEVEWTLNRSQ